MATFVPRRASGALTAAFVVIVALAGSCPPSSGPTPVTSSLSEVVTDIARGGRTVAVSISAANAGIAIVASGSGGLFRTTDGGDHWTHVDAFTPFRVQEVAFAEPGATDLAVVIATTIRDGRTDPVGNGGGVWRSADAGVTWTHVATGVCAAPFNNAFDVAFAGTGTIFVAAECGLLRSTDLGLTWTAVIPGEVTSFAVRPLGTSFQVDACERRRGVARSVNGGTTFGTPVMGPSCFMHHTLAVSPLEPEVLFGIFDDNTLRESDDGGATWFDLGATAFNERPLWVRTRQAMDGNAAHFDLHFPGRVVTCTNAGPGRRCPFNASESWPRVPANPLNHDINGIAFTPGTACARLMAADYGVYRAPTATPGFPCGNPASWTGVGRANSGNQSLEVYQVSGQIQYPLSGGVSVSGSTHLFMGTQDNGVWANYDGGPVGWQYIGIEGAYIHVPRVADLRPPGEMQATYLELGSNPPSASRLVPGAGGAWQQRQLFTAVTPPGNAMAPVLVTPGVYVEWSGTTLMYTPDVAITWFNIATLPANPMDAMDPLRLNRFGGGQVAKTSAGTALWEFVTDGAGRSGLGLLGTVALRTTPIPLELRTFANVTNQGGTSGLQSIGRYCFQPNGGVCQPVFAVDPNDYRNLIAADVAASTMASTSDAGRTWHAMQQLTSLVTGNGSLAFIDGMGAPQVHAIAFDPDNSQHVLVGTDEAGIFASGNGGLTWHALPATAMATNISSFFFDGRTNVVYVSTYGRGLWKLTVDWTTVGP